MSSASSIRHDVIFIDSDDDEQATPAAAAGGTLAAVVSPRKRGFETSNGTGAAGADQQERSRPRQSNELFVAAANQPVSQSAAAAPSSASPSPTDGISAQMQHISMPQLEQSWAMVPAAGHMAAAPLSASPPPLQPSLASHSAYSSHHAEALVAPPNYRRAPAPQDAPIALQLFQAGIHGIHSGAQPLWMHNVGLPAVASAFMVNMQAAAALPAASSSMAAAPVAAASAVASPAVFPEVSVAAAASSLPAAPSHAAGLGAKVDGFFVDPDGVFFEKQRIKIYNSQHNIAMEIMRRAAQHNLFQMWDAQPDGTKSLHRFDDFNVLFLGPSFTDLQKQTAGDLREFLTYKLPEYDHLPWLSAASSLNEFLQQGVLNSSSLKLNKADSQAAAKETPWLTKLRENKPNVLHLLVCDEAHWGIATGSVIDQFLSSAAAVIEQCMAGAHPEGSPPINVLLLKVSATADVLYRVKHLPTVGEDSKGRRVNWNALRRDPNRPYFEAKSYRDITSLPLWNDLSPSLMSLTTTSERAVHVAREYVQVVKQWILLHFGASFVAGASVGSSAVPDSSKVGAARVLSHVLPKLDVDGDYNSFGRVHEYASGDMALVRLVSNQEIRALQDDIQKMFDHVTNVLRAQHPEQKWPEFQPFEVIAMVADDPDSPQPASASTVIGQLSEKARRFLTKKGRLNASTPSLAAIDLEDLPCLLLVNFKLGMGERLPRTCMAFDVRGKYIGEFGRVGSTEATFVQDIGRCAGHNKPAAEILMCISDPYHLVKNEQPVIHDLMFPQAQRHLASDSPHDGSMGGPAGAHPEAQQGSRAMSRLDPWTIILDAEPQIGKTGAILALVNILLKNHSVKPRTGAAVPPSTPASSSHHPPFSPPHPESASHQLSKKTKAFCDLINNTQLGSIDVRVKLLMGIFERQSREFIEYHDALREFIHAQYLSNAIAKDLASEAVRAQAEHDAAAGPFQFRVADAGCGMNGTVVALRRFLAQPAWAKKKLSGVITVVGMDLSTEIEKLVEHKQDAAANTSAAAAASSSSSSSSSSSAASASSSSAAVASVASPPVVHFVAEVGDMCSARVRGPFHAVVYSLSLFETDITRHLRWAHQHLVDDNGRLIIADVPRRFGDTELFLRSMFLAGFELCDKSPAQFFDTFTFQKVPQQLATATVMLEPY